MIPPDCKNCKNDCKIVYAYTASTSLFYIPVFDKDGVNINPDGNVISGSAKCLTCDQEWDFSTQYGNTIWKKLYAN